MLGYSYKIYFSEALKKCTHFHKHTHNHWDKHSRKLSHKHLTITDTNKRLNTRTNTSLKTCQTLAQSFGYPLRQTSREKKVINYYCKTKSLFCLDLEFDRTWVRCSTPEVLADQFLHGGGLGPKSGRRRLATAKTKYLIIFTYSNFEQKVKYIELGTVYCTVNIHFNNKKVVY